MEELKKYDMVIKRCGKAVNTGAGKPLHFPLILSKIIQKRIVARRLSQHPQVAILK